MEKPKSKKEVAIKAALKELGLIYFYASQDAKEDFKEFGYISEGISTTLFVDPRFDFDEVLAYIENYG